MLDLGQKLFWLCCRVFYSFLNFAIIEITSVITVCASNYGESRWPSIIRMVISLADFKQTVNISFDGEPM